MEMAKTAGIQVIVMFLLMAAGYACVKFKVLTDRGVKDINKLLLVLVTPAIIIHSYCRPFDAVLFKNLLQGFLLAVIAHIIAIAISFGLIRGRGDRVKIERFALIFSNSGFMGIPLISALLGNEGIIYATSYIAVFTLTQWTVGVLLLSGRSDIKTTVRKLVVNPGIISVALGISIFVLSIKVPSPVVSALGFIADLNTPVAMMLVGAFAAQSNILKSFTDPKVYYVSFLRLILVPLLMIPVYMALDLSQTLVVANFIAAACPVAALAAMFPALYGHDANYGSFFITVSTILSVVTIPLMVLVLGFTLGLG
jgi:predicted permease